MQNSFTFREGVEKSYGYDHSFKKEIRKRPELIEMFQKTTDQLKSVGDHVSKGDITIKLFLVREGVKIPGRDQCQTKYYKVDIGKNSYFVKSCHGFRELKDSLEAKEKLKHLKGVEIVDLYYGFSDSQGEGYFVAKWLELPTIENLHTTLPENEYRKLEMRVEEARTILGPAYFDTRIGNAFYDKKRDAVILFDLNKIAALETTEKPK